MIIDLLNFCQYNPGTEAKILFRLQESQITVPSFFCITEDYTEDELNNYLSNHYQYTTNFTVRLSLSLENSDAPEISLPEKPLPHYVNIPKSIVVRYADRLFAEAKEYVQEKYPNEEDQKHITAHVIVQEMVHANVFGCMQTACNMGVINETVILIGEGHDSDFAQRGVPFSIYCHNDDDGILYAHEPENAARADRRLLQSLLKLSKKLKALFGSYKLEVKFIADYSLERIYVVTVQQISELSDNEASEIILDTRGICNYYPGVTLPLQATIVQLLSHDIIRQIFDQITNKPASEPELLDLVVYVNGRLYFHTQRLHRLQEILSFHEESEEYVNQSIRRLFQELRKEHGFLRWREKRKMAVGIQRLMEKNLEQRQDMCMQFQAALNKLTQIDKNSLSYEQLFETFEGVFQDLSDCLRANLFNTLYININRKLMNRLKPSDKKYKHTADITAVASKYRTVLRAYHAKFMEQFIEYGKCMGKAFKDLGCIENPEDIFYLSLEETFEIRRGNHTPRHAQIQQLKQTYAWYRSMPSFSRLVFHKEIVDAPLGTIDFLDTLKENCYLRGSGLVPGNAVYPAIVCTDNQIPDDCSPKCIYVVHKLTNEMTQKTLGGLIAEQPDVFANLNSNVAECNFPIVTGAEHACTLIENGDLIDLNGANGDVCITCMKNIEVKP